MRARTTSAVGPRGHKRARLLAGALSVTAATFGAVAIVASGNASAFAPLQTQGYTIGGASSSVSGLSASVVPNTTPGTGNYRLTFTTPSALAVSANKASASYLRIVDASTTSAAYNNIVAAVLSSGVGIVDPSTGYTSTATVANGFLTMGTAQGSLSAAESVPLVVYLGGSGTVNAGDTLTLTFAASNPGAGTYSFYASTSASPTWVASTNTLTIAASAGGATVTAGSYGLGIGTTYQMSNVAVPVTIPAGTTTLNLQACTNTGAPPPAQCAVSSSAGGTGSVRFSGGAGGYSVVDTTTGATLAVSSVSPISGSSTTVGGVTLQLSVPAQVPAGNDLSITATGFNPTTNESDYFVVGFSASVVAAGPVSFGGTVSNLSLSLSNTTAGSTATYTATFNVGPAGAMAPGGTITLTAPGTTAFANPTGATVTDNTTGASQVLTGVTPSTTTSLNDTVALTTSLSISNNDTLTVQVYGVLNPPAGTYSGTTGFSVKTSSDPVPAYAPTYVISSAVSGTSPTVTVTPNTAGSLATYVIGTFRAASPLIGGTDTIEVLGPAGTAFPYSATLSSPSGSQTLAARSGAGTNDVTYLLATTVPAGSSLTLTMAGTVNPAGGNYSLFLGADTEAANTTAGGGQGLAAAQAPATTTTAPTTTTTKPPARPAVTSLTSRSTVSNGSVSLRLRCANARCQGTIKLWSHNVLLGQSGYGIGAGGTATFFIHLDARAIGMLKGAKGGVLGAGQTIFVDGGATVRLPLTLVYPLPPRPVASALSGGPTKVSSGEVGIRLHCANAHCRGVIKLWSHNILLAQTKYGMDPGATATFYLQLNSRALALLSHAPGHALASGQTIFVDNGATVRRGITLVG